MILQDQSRHGGNQPREEHATRNEKQQKPDPNHETEQDAQKDQPAQKRDRALERIRGAQVVPKVALRHDENRSAQCQQT